MEALNLEKQYKIFKNKLNKLVLNVNKNKNEVKNKKIVREKKELFIPQCIQEGGKFRIFSECEPETETMMYYNKELQRFSFSQTRKYIDLESIVEIRYGGEGQEWVWGRYYKYKELRNQIFFIIFKKDGDFDTFNLIAESEQMAIDWVRGIRDYLIYFNEDFEYLRYNGITDKDLWLKRAWNMADTNFNNFISEKELKDVLEVLNIKMNSSARRKALKKFKAHTNKNGEIDYEGFVKFFDELDERSDAQKIFDYYTDCDDYLDKENFKKFLTEAQQEKLTEEEIQTRYEKFQSNENGINFENFIEYLYSLENSVMVHDDLDDSYKLNDYFMASSHNTYLIGNQLAGEASVEGYVRCIQKGCRCIEIDCWDGPNGEPKATHGMTLTSNIMVKSILQAIAIYGFKKTPYPMLLSLENHCSLEQQVTLAKHIREILKDRVVLMPITDNDELPRLEDLKFKVIVKVEFKLSLKESLVEGKDAAIPLEEHTGNPGNDNDNNEEDDDDYADLTKDAESNSKYPISLELCSLTVYCKSKPFKGIETALQEAKNVCACCVSEANSLKLYEKNRDEYIEMNKIQMTRVYPVGKRITSSNYNPVPHWLCGSQVVALNYQKFDRGTDINDAMFFQNNYNGYILKPKFLLSNSDVKRSEKYSRLTLKVISAQKLVKPKFKDDGDIIDSQVTIEVLADSVLKEGNSKDKQGNAQENKFRSKICKNNGFNPEFNEVTTYIFKNPELAFVRIKVHEYNLLKKQVIGSITIPVTKLKPGFRQLSLRDRVGDPLPFSSLFVHVKREDEIADPQI